ncbi:MAG TPA: ATP-binding protein [Flavilitoribacter sp.]|nr:ATP-binding protein [Flavilitoribacter sp.]HMQ89515.1 ATP-binding protein [Flavilitoribacter sp.]
MNGQPYFEAFVRNNLGEILNTAGRFSEAADHAEAGLEAAVKADNLEQQARANEILAEALFSLQDYDGARKAFKATLTLRDSLNRKEKADEFARLETRYQSREQEALLTRQNLELEKAAYFRRMIVIGSLAVFFLLAILVQFWRQRQKIKEKEVQLAYQLERSEKESLKELDRLKSTFFANISHEFRTPLTLLISPLQEIREGTFKGSLPKYARIMERNARRLLQLVNQLLDLSRLEAGKMQLNLQPGDLMQALRAITGSFESFALIRQITFLVEIPQQQAFVRFDRDKLEKIAANLLSNAFKFTREEGMVSVTANYRDDRLELEVKDNGIGIAKEHLPQLFERFFQHKNAAESDSGEQQGSGIGLALTKELIELHNGRVEVESEPGKGTLFRVVLPFPRIVDEKEPVAHLTAEEPEKIRFEPKKVKDQDPVILIAEDNEDIRLYVRDRLSVKYRVLEAADGASGLKIALREVPDLIISDVIMPEMDGLEFCKAVKTHEQTSHIPVILLTAKAGHQEKLEGLNTGADDYLIKPFDGEELETRIINLLNQREFLRRRYSQMVFQFKPSDIRLPSANEQFLQRTTLAIEENIDDEGFGVEELARAIGMSRHHLHRKLKALIGQTPVIFIRTIRLERALQLLQQQVGNASEVAFMVGFGSLTYFSKCFSEHFGFSPSKVNTP